MPTLTTSGSPWRRCVLAVCLAALTTAFVPAPAGAQVPVVKLDEFAKVRLDDLAEAQRTWLERDVLWIITEPEREVFLRLDSDAQREVFIEQFWRNRDPSPGTERNEYREAIDKRLIEADRDFGRETSRPGRLTDRGRMKVLLGDPRSVDRYPGSPGIYPVEIWSYAVDPIIGTPAFFNLLFFKDRGYGEHILFSPLGDGPEALLTPAGQNEATEVTSTSLSARRGRPTSFGDLGGVLEILKGVDLFLADVAVNFVPGDGASQDFGPLRSEELLVDIEGVPERAMPDPTWAYRMLVGAVESDVRFDTLPLQMDAVALMDPAGIPYLHYAIRMPGNRINLGHYEDRYYATYELTVGVRADELRFLRAPEPEVVQLDLDADASATLRGSDLIHLGRIPLPDGNFSVDLLAENNVTHEIGRADARGWAPAAHPAKLNSSKAILISEHNSFASGYDPFGEHVPFQIGKNFLMPALRGPFPSGSTIWVFHQLYAPAGAADAVTATYVIRDAAGTVRATKSSPLQLQDQDRFGVLSQLAGLSLEGLTPGDYTVQVDIDADDRAPQDLAFTVVPGERYVMPVPHARRMPSARDDGERLIRARQMRTLGRTDEAIEILRAVLERTPGHEGALALQVDLLSDAGRLDELAALLAPLLAKDPANGEMLVLLADVTARQANFYDAIRYYERARLAGVAETPELLNSLAAAYMEQDRPDKAEELLRRSLELSPEQAGIRTMLQRVATDSR